MILITKKNFIIPVFFFVSLFFLLYLFFLQSSLLDNFNLTADANEVIYENEKTENNEEIFFVNGLPKNENRQFGPRKIYNSVNFETKAKNAVVLDIRDKRWLLEQSSQEKVPIASITKLMTALVFLDFNLGWEDIYTIERKDRREGGRIYLYQGEKVFIKDLFYTALIPSANTATIALIHATGFEEKEFVDLMNKKALELGLINTHFDDPVGLSERNVSTAKDIAMLAKMAFEKEEISEVLKIKEYSFKTLNGRTKYLTSTNGILMNVKENEDDQLLVFDDLFFLAGKTGFIDAAGYCFVGKFSNEDGHEIISVILNTEKDQDRFTETEKMISWIYENYQWK